MRKIFLSIAFLIFTIFTFAGCSAKANTDSNQDEVDVILNKINAEEAKKMMDESSNLIVLDVRTEDEYNSGHIDGALLIPDNEIKAKAEELLSDKSATILVYCRSGRRSALAASALSELGYTVIYDFGGILDWPYDIVIE